MTLVTTPPAAAAIVGHVSFWFTGTTYYRYVDRVVQLYDDFIAGAIAKHAGAEDALVGPFYLRTPLALKVADQHTGVGSDGVAIDGPADSRHDRYIRPVLGTSTTTLIAKAPKAIADRVLIATAAGDEPQRFTPVALAAPTDVAIHCDIDWDCNCDYR